MLCLLVFDFLNDIGIQEFDLVALVRVFKMAKNTDVNSLISFWIVNFQLYHFLQDIYLSYSLQYLHFFQESSINQFSGATRTSCILVLTYINFDLRGPIATPRVFSLIVEVLFSVWNVFHRFFDTTPLGRVLNRLAADTLILDVVRTNLAFTDHWRM